MKKKLKSKTLSEFKSYLGNAAEVARKTSRSRMGSSYSILHDKPMQELKKKSRKRTRTVVIKIKR